MTWKDILKREIKIQQFNILLTFYTKSGRPYPPMNIEEEIMDTKEGAIKVAEKLMDEAEEGLDYETIKRLNTVVMYGLLLMMMKMEMRW